MDFETDYTLQAYQAQAARTSARHLQDEERLWVSTLGLTSEVGELAGEFKHVKEQDRELNLLYIREELSDCLWYLSDICTIMGWSLAEVAHENILKLQKRHPEGFSAATSVARMDKNGD